MRTDFDGHGLAGDAPPHPGPPAPGATRASAPVPGSGAPEDVYKNRFEGASILVVDDDFRNVVAIKAVLERGRADVVVAPSGAAALSALALIPEIDIVLIDIMMPGMDGYDTIRAIRATGRFDSLPVIAITCKTEAGERERCLAAGADTFLPRPPEMGALLAAVETAFAATQKARAER
jgi:CheY-like chemotaxis protein